MSSHYASKYSHLNKEEPHLKSQPSLPSLRLILFSAQRPPIINTLVQAFEALGQQVILVVTSPGIQEQPFPTPACIIAYATFGQNILVARNMDRLPDMLSSLAPDLIFTSGFPLRFSRELLALPRLGCVNAHPSLLPKYRGLYPVLWHFLNNETEGGMTLHRMDGDFNTGPILVQRKQAIAPNDDIRSLWRKLIELEVSMLPEMLSLVAAGDPGTPQPSAGASYAPPIDPNEYQLDWTRPAHYLYNQVRAFAFLGTRAIIDGQPMLVRQARVFDVKSSERPGSLLACSSQGVLVQTGQDALLVTEYVSEDEGMSSLFPQTR